MITPTSSYSGEDCTFRKNSVSPWVVQRKAPDDGDLRDHGIRVSNFDDIVSKINYATKKCTKLVHLRKPLHNYLQRDGSEDKPAVELPTLLQWNTQHPKPLKDILGDCKKNKWLFFGSGGSGKTTVLKTIARGTVNRVFEGFRDTSAVIFLKCGDLSIDKHTSLYKFLLSNVEPEVEDLELAKFEELICKDPSKLLIVMDDLDMLPRSFYSKGIRQVAETIGNIGNSSVADILVALLTSRSLPGCRIVASSQTLEIFRVVPQIVNEMMPVQLAGFTNESIYCVSRQYLEQNQAERLMQFLETHATVLDLCRTPVFLIATVLGQRESPSFMPSNASETLIYLLGQFFHSAGMVGSIWLKQLAKIAFELLSGSKYDFNPAMLSDYQGIRDNLCGLVFETHKKSCSVSFVHRSIQEMLATLYLIGLERHLFGTEVALLDQFSFVFQCLGGLLCNNNTFAVASRCGLVSEDDEWQCKRDIFLKLLHRKVDKLTRSQCNSFEVLNTIHILNECEWEVRKRVSSNLRKIRIKDCPISHIDVHALSLLALASLEELALSSCALNVQHMQMLCNSVRTNAKKIRKLDFSLNNLTPDAVRLAGMIASMSSAEELDISGTPAFDADDGSVLLSLKTGLGNHKLKILKINYANADMKEAEMKIDLTESEIKYVYKLKDNHEKELLPFPLPHEIIRRIQRKSLWKTASYDVTRAIVKLMPNASQSIHVCCWKFSEEWKEILQNSLKVNNHRDLEIVLSSQCVIRYNRHSSSPDITNVEPTCENGYVSDAMPEESLGQVDESPKYRVAHRRVNNEDLKMLGLKISMRKHLEEIELRECGLTVDFLCNLLNKVKNSHDGIQIKKLSITAENNIAKLIPAICQLMVSCCTSDLNLEESDGSAMMLKILCDFVEKFKVQLKVLNLSYIKNMGDYHHLGILMSNRVCELHLVNCGLNSSFLGGLQCITNSQVNYLDISYNPEIDGDAIQVIPGILCKNKKISLLMQGCELDEYDADAFKEFDGMQLQLLDLSYNETLENEGIEKVCEFANACQVKELCLSSCGLDDECITTLSSTLHQKLDKLDLSQNPGIAYYSKEIVCLIENSRLPNLALRDCHMIYGQIRDLATSLKQQTINLEQIDIRDRDRRSWDSKYFDAVDLLSSCVKDKLWLCLPIIDNKECDIQGHRLSWIKQFSKRTVFHIEWI